MTTTTPRLRKGEATRRLILERAAPVFNQRGYAGASMSELVEATGIEKGGIYNHFGSKEDLDVDPYELATLVTSTLEGSLMLTRLFDDPAYKHRAVASLVEHVKGMRKSPRQRKGRAKR